MLPDNRIRLPGPNIDFTNDVGVTGQDHDTYPSAGQQPRYDWMRMYLIGLLSNQSSYTAPSQKRVGTLWFNLNDSSLNIYTDDGWVSLADTIYISATMTLSDWFTEVGNNLTTYGLERSFCGHCTADGVSSIAIPTSLRSTITDTSRAFVYINGLLVRPIDVVMNSTTISLLNDITLSDGDKFVVSIREIPDIAFITTSISVP